MTGGPGTSASGGDPGTRRYQVTHRTVYGYDRPVTACYGRAHLLPRDAPGQRCLRAGLELSPQPDLLTEATDYFGNRSAYLEVHHRHTEFVVTADSVVEITRDPPDLTVLDALSCAQTATGWAGTGWGGTASGSDPHLVEYTLPSPQVPFDRAVRRYAAGILAPQRPLGQALAELVHRLHEDIAHVPGSISPATTLAEVLTRREGTSQDLAGLAVGCLRLAGLPARCVSGYLVGGHPQTPPPPGPAKPAGADAVHAWVSVCVPQWGWVDLDPTHDRPTDDRYVVTAWGRDHADMLPLRGVVFTDGTESTLTVGVDVVRL